MSLTFWKSQVCCHKTYFPGGFVDTLQAVKTYQGPERMKINFESHFFTPNTHAFFFQINLKGN